MMGRMFPGEKESWFSRRSLDMDGRGGFIDATIAYRALGNRYTGSYLEFLMTYEEKVNSPYSANGYGFYIREIGDYSKAKSTIVIVDGVKNILLSDPTVSERFIYVNNPSGQGVNNISDAGLQFIARHEGYSSSVYNDAGGYPTIGYGHLILPGENYSKGITKAQGLKLLNSDARNSVNIINRLVTTPLNQNQFDALASYVFNTGSLNGTRLLRNLNAGNFTGAASEMDIVTSGGQVVRGLQIRRADEQNLFLYGKY